MSERPNTGREDGRDQTRHPLPVHSHALHDASQDAVLDVQAIPHFVRHAAILGALSSLNPGFSRCWRRSISCREPSTTRSFRTAPSSGSSG